MSPYPGAALPAEAVAPQPVPTLPEERVETTIRPRLAQGDAAAFATEYRRLRATAADRPRWGPIGWKLGLVIDIALLSLPIPAVIAIPPLLDRRHISLNVGFFAGDSFESCAARRIGARWKHLDARIKMHVRGSGR